MYVSFRLLFFKCRWKYVIYTNLYSLFPFRQHHKHFILSSRTFSKCNFSGFSTFILIDTMNCLHTRSLPAFCIFWYFLITAVWGKHVWVSAFDPNCFSHGSFLELDFLGKMVHSVLRFLTSAAKLPSRKDVTVWYGHQRESLLQPAWREFRKPISGV